MRYKRYKKYKDSGFEFIKDIPEFWSINRLKNISNVEISNVDKKSIEEEQTVKLCNYVDVYYNDKITDKINFMEATAKPEQIKKFSLKEGDVLLTKDSETPDDITVPAWTEKDLEGVLCGYHLALIRPNDSVNGIYLYYSLTSSGFRDQFYSNANGVTRFGLFKDVIRNTLLFIPTLEEQEQIANFLDKKTSKIDALIIDKEKLITLLEEKRQAIITEAVTKGLNPNVKMKNSGVEWIGEIPEHWEVKKIKYITQFIGSGKTPRGGAEVYSNEGIIFIRSQNVYDDGLRLEDIVYIDEEINNEMKSTMVKPNDVLLNITGASIGRTSLVPINFPKANVNQHVCILRPNVSKIVPAMFSKIVSSQFMKNQIFSIQNGSSREGLNFSQIGNLILLLPSELEEQIQIANFLEERISEIGSLKVNIQLQIQKLKAYRQSLIFEAVTGKIDVRNYSKEACEF